MKNAFYSMATIFLLVIFILPEISLADDFSLSKSKAQSIVSNHIKYAFFPVRIGEFTLGGKKAAFYKSVLSKLSSAKVVDSQVVPLEKKCFDVGGGEKGPLKAYTFNVTLTDKATEYGYFHSEKPDDIIGLIVGDRKVLEILDVEKIEKKNAFDIGFIIHFTYAFDVNDLGRSLGATSDKRNRGKLFCSYSKMQEKLIIWDFQYSLWKPKKWKYGTFSDELDGKAYFRARYLRKIYRGLYSCK